MGRLGKWEVFNGNRLFEICYEGTWKQTTPGNSLARQEMVLSARKWSCPPGNGLARQEMVLPAGKWSCPPGNGLVRKNKKRAGDSGESPAKLIERRPLLRDDERLRVHPIRVTQYAQRADLEVIDSSQREPTDGYLLGSGDRDGCPRAQYPASAFECVPHIKGNSACLIYGLHHV